MQIYNMLAALSSQFTENWRLAITFRGFGDCISCDSGQLHRPRCGYCQRTGHPQTFIDAAAPLDMQEGSLRVIALS